MVAEGLPIDTKQTLSVPHAGNEVGCVPPDAAATFEAVARQYLALKEPGWGAHATHTAKCIIQRHLIGNLGHRRVGELSAVEIQEFIDGLVRNNASQSLLKKAVGHLRGILELAQELDIIKRNPMRSSTVKFEYKSQKQKTERCLSLEECRALLSELFGRDRLIVRMFIQLGLRPEELFALRRDDVQDDFLRVDEVYTKGEIRETPPGEPPVNVYVPPALRQELRAWMASGSGRDKDWLFSARSRRTAKLSPIRPNGFRNGVLKPAARRAGIPDIDLLTLRRTCATHFGQKASAKDAQAQMRTSNPFTTLKFPEQRLPESLRQVATALEAEILTSAEVRSLKFVPLEV